MVLWRVLEALLVLVPVLGAYVVHAPILRFDLWPALRRPLDGGARIRGRRVLGDNKTWRGVLAMFAGVLAAAIGLAHLEPYWSRLPDPIRRAGPVVFGTLVGLGMVLGELPNSFLKRQLDIAPGGRRRSALGLALTVLDQGDFVLAIWLFLAPVWAMTPAQAALAFLVVVVVHLGINLIGHAIGARTSRL